MANNTTDLYNEVYRALFAALEGKLHLVGSVVMGDAKEAIIEQNIKDQGDFYRNADYRVARIPNALQLTVGSNVAHEPYVLGGKVPSWTPFEPIKSWVERHEGYFEFKSNNKEKEIDSIAWAIIHKIKREGIPGRNVFAEVMKNRKKWIYEQFTNLEVAL